MFYRKIKLYILLVILVTACKNNNDQSKFQNESNLIEIHNDKLGIIPKDHKIYKTKDYGDMLTLYKNFKKEDSNSHYYQNLCNYTIFKIFQSDFFQKSNAEERRFFLNEMANLEYALPNLENFYNLINFMLKNEEVKVKEVMPLAKKFAKKNITQVKETIKSDVELKQKKLSHIDKGMDDILLFQRRQLLNKFSEGGH